MFAQVNPDPLPPDVPDVYYEPSLLDWLAGMFACFVYPVLTLAALALKVWMAIECLRKDPDRYLWIWIIIFVPFGSVIYLFLRWLPNNQVRAPGFMQKWTRGKEIDRLRLAAAQIGNAHQHIGLGDALSEIDRHAEAAEAYEQALEKEPDNLQALWGMAQVEMHLGDFNSAHERLKKVLDVDPAYKFGDVSFAYGKTLCELGQTEAAIRHLDEHVRRWPHPEALYTLACLHVDEGHLQQARKRLLEMMLGINSSPRGIARKFGIWKSKGRRLLKRLPPAGSGD